MTFPFNFSGDTNQENLAPNSELIENDVMELANKLSKKVHTEILLRETYIKSTDAFIAKRKLNAALDSTTGANFNELKNYLSKTLPSSVVDSNLLFSNPSSNVDSKKLVQQVYNEYLAYLRTYDQNLYKTEVISLFERLTTPKPNQKFRLAFIPRKKHRKRLSVVIMTHLTTAFILFFIYKLVIVIYRICVMLVEIVFQFFVNKVSSKKLKLKKRSTIEEDEKEKNGKPKKFWQKPLGLVSKIIKMNRGGSLVQLQEINIDQFSEFERQQDLLIVSPISGLSKSETTKLGLERFEIEYPESHRQGKFSRLKSKVKKLIPSQALNRIYNILVIFVGILIFLAAAKNENRISPQNRNLPNVERVVPGQQLIISDLSRFTTPIEEPQVNEKKMIMSMPIPTNEPFKTTESISSRVKSVNRTRKKTKVVHLSDLPPLVDQYWDQDIDVTSSSTPTDIKIKTL